MYYHCVLNLANFAYVLIEIIWCVALPPLTRRVRACLEDKYSQMQHGSVPCCTGHQALDTHSNSEKYAAVFAFGTLEQSSRHSEREIARLKVQSSLF